MGWAFARACDGVLKIDRVQDGGRRGAGDLDPEAVKRGKNGARNGGDGQEPDHDLRSEDRWRGCVCAVRAGRSVRNLWPALNSDDLNKMGAAVDEEATQDNENQSYGDERPPIVFEEWVAPLAIVADRRIRRQAIEYCCL
jgi:hypothetical protein